MSNPPFLHSRPWAMENLAPQPSQWVGLLAGVLQYRRCNASPNFISMRQVPLTYRNLVGFIALVCFLLLRMVRLVAACIGSVMRLSWLSLNVWIAAFADAMVWVCYFKGCRIFQWTNVTSFLAWWFGVVELSVFDFSLCRIFTLWVGTCYACKFINAV